LLLFPLLASCSSQGVESGAAPRLTSWLRSSAAQGVLGGRTLRSPTDEWELQNRLLIGAQLYDSKCAGCHEDRRRRGRAPRQGPLLSERRFDPSERQALLTLIRDGRGEMPAFEARMSRAQMEDLVEYLLQPSLPPSDASGP
jgi:mono/diheme cytochrome c family protein